MKNNEYTDIKLIEDKLYIKINGIDTIFSTNYDVNLITRLKVFLSNNLWLNSFIGFKSTENFNCLTLTRTIKNNELSVEIIDEEHDTLAALYKLKQEVGYEIINKLKEIFGDELDEE